MSDYPAKTVVVSQFGITTKHTYLYLLRVPRKNATLSARRLPADKVLNNEERRALLNCLQYQVSQTETEIELDEEHRQQGESEREIKSKGSSR